MAEVSVIIPTYNRAAMLKESLASVLAQTFGDLDICVVDDGSTDETESVVASFSDSRVRYIRQEHTGSAGAARNRGLRESRGAFVSFLDSDDRWAPDTMEKLRKALLEHGEWGLAYGDIRLAGPARSERIERHLRNARRRSGRVFPHLLMDNFIFIQSVLVRRECLDQAGFFEEGRDILIGEDWEFFLRIAFRHQVGYVEGASGYYAIHGANVNQDAERSCRDEMKILRKLREKLNIDQELFNRAMAKRHFFLGKHRLLQRDNSFRDELRKALSLDRGNPLRWSGFLLSLLPVPVARSIYLGAKKVRDAAMGR